MKVLTKKRKITKYIVMTAVFVALGYILSFLEIPMPAPIAFLKLDFSNVMTMLCGFTLGPRHGRVRRIKAAIVVLYAFDNRRRGRNRQLYNDRVVRDYSVNYVQVQKGQKKRRAVVVRRLSYAGCICAYSKPFYHVSALYG